MNKLMIGLGIVLISLLISISVDIYAYKVEINTEVHQHITNESSSIWKLIPYEITIYLGNSLQVYNNDNDFNLGDTVITGSAEEDYLANPRNHFFQPDNPGSSPTGIDDYDDGISILGSSYRKALELWQTKVIPNYLKRNFNESYYWLGRVVHLLEDVAQPSHVHLDPHTNHFGDGSSILEDYTGSNFTRLQNTYNWDGNNFAGQQYYYENLIDNFNWSLVEPKRVPDKQFIELFRLFWYTAQKTQYWASDDNDGNTVYTTLSGNQQNWDCSGSGNLNLWKDFNYTSCNNFISDHTTLNQNTVDQETNATIPHAMKSTAGLYRLFWDTVHSFDWPTYHHDNQRTGFTLLKGDIDATNTKNDIDYILQSTTEDALTRPAIGDVNHDGLTDLVITASSGDNLSNVYFLSKEKQSWKNKFLGQKTTEISNPVSFNEVIETSTELANTDNDDKLEVLIGLDNGTLLLIDDGKIKWGYTVSNKTSISQGSVRGEISFIGVSDLNHDGTNEIIFMDGKKRIDDWPGDVYVIRDNGTYYDFVDSRTIGGTGGGFAAPAIINIDNDANEEIVLATFYGLRVMDFTNFDAITQKCSNSDKKLIGAPVIYDIDRDNQYEVIYNSNNCFCDLGGCTNEIHIVNATTCQPDDFNGVIALDIFSQVSPSIANLDSDNNFEVVVNGRTNCSLGNEDSYIQAYDSSSDNKEWEYFTQAIRTAPNIADIDGNGNYDIILASTTNNVTILNNDGSVNQLYGLAGAISGSPIIGDIDHDGKAELAVKRAGSPLSIFSSITGNNTQPLIVPLDNITARETETININGSGQLKAFDADNNILSYDYSAPFDESGLWSTNINDTGNYSILVGVNDGNLSDSQFIEVKIFPKNSTRINTYTTGNSSASFSYSQPQNQSVQVRIPKNATILYSRIKIGGSS